VNYPKDFYLRGLEKDDHWIYLDEILKFPMMKKHRISSDMVKNISNYSNVFELDPLKFKIRRKEQTINQDIKLLGLDKEGIRNLSVERYDAFMEVKK
jgi:hypothetical protein